MPWLLDGIAILFILFWGYRGFKNGLIEELGRLLGLIIAILISISSSANLSLKLVKFLPMDAGMSIFLSFGLLFISTILVARVFTRLAKIAFLSNGNQLINRTLGLFFGATKGVSLIIVIVWVIAILPLQKWSTYIEKNSSLANQGNILRVQIVSFFNWEDPIILSESYIKKITQP